MSFFKKLKTSFSNFINTKRNKVDKELLEETLIEADFGVELSEKIVSEIETADDFQEAFRTKIESILTPLVGEITVDTSKKPFVIVLEGINGSGKTTTVAKLASLLKSQGFSVDIAACDTFRVAATEQLAVWAERLNCRIFKSDSPKDPSSVAFDALKQTTSDVLIIDTAGRLHNNSNLMSELEKIHRVIKKFDLTAPHLTILTLDATIGQNTIEQIKEFAKAAPISGLIINKLDGGAKCGVIVRAAEEFKLPILAVGVGESEKDLEKFSVSKFLQDLER